LHYLLKTYGVLSRYEIPIWDFYLQDIILCEYVLPTPPTYLPARATGTTAARSVDTACHAVLVV